MKKSVCFISVLGSLITMNAYSQEAFSLIDMNKMVLNPAFTASDTCYKNTASLYSGLPKYFDGSPDITKSNSIGLYQMRLDKIHSGIGIMVNEDYMRLGTTETDNQIAAKLYYRYTVFSSLSIGVDAGFVNERTHLTYDYIAFTGSGFYPLGYPPVTTNTFDFDGGIGLLYQIKRFYLGFTMDHLTNPKAIFPDYGDSAIITGYSSYPMQYYQGIAYNWIIGSNIPIGKYSIDLSASYYQLYKLYLNATLQASHFFIGFSVIQDNNYENHVFDKGDYYYYAAIAGIKTCKNKVKVSFASNFFPSSTAPYSLVIIEGGVSYSF